MQPGLVMEGEGKKNSFRNMTARPASCVCLHLLCTSCVSWGRGNLKKKKKDSLVPLEKI